MFSFLRKSLRQKRHQPQPEACCEFLYGRWDCPEGNWPDCERRKSFQKLCDELDREKLAAERPAAPS
jgi:hypothetical protein